jgi:CubicO group peptidase (beta-lactamase class C family)
VKPERNHSFKSVGVAVLAGLLIMATVAPALAAADETAAKVDKIFAAWDKTTSPGASLAVIKDGKIVYERGYGMAKLEDGLVNTPDRVFDIGSVSKQFTAACLAMLVRDGKVRVEDDIGKYLPGMPAYGKTVTVGHLLHHTSGLRDYNALLDLAGFRPDADSPTVEEAVEIIRRQKKLNYAPGEEYSYTNSGYFLLGQIVQRVSGKSLNAFAQERIFRPLGMTKTLFQDDHTQIIADRATGYTRPKGGGYKICMSSWDETGDGNVYTTVRDLALWDQAFYSGALGRDLMDLLQTRGGLNSGQTIDYAWGLVISEYKGLKVVEHGGAWVGFRAALVRFPEERFSVIILANLDLIDPSGLAFRVADIYLADRIKKAWKAPAPEPGEAVQAEFAVSPAGLESLVGNWEDIRFGQWMAVSLKDGQATADLIGRTFRLKPVGPGRFIAAERGDVVIEFKAGEKDKPATARMAVGTSLDFRFEKQAPLKALDAAALAAYAGPYVSEELLDARYVISVDKGRLVLKTRTAPRAELKPMAPDKFTVPGYGLNIEFVRTGGRVSGFTVSVGRAAGIAFAGR